MSAGGAWPDGSKLDDKANVLLWSSEDRMADTIIPRLIAMGADRKLPCVIITGGKAADGSPLPFDFATGVEARTEIERIGGRPS